MRTYLPSVEGKKININQQNQKVINHANIPAALLAINPFVLIDLKPHATGN